MNKLMSSTLEHDSSAAGESDRSSSASKPRIVGYRGPERDHVIGSQIQLPSSRQHLLPSELWSIDVNVRDEIDVVLQKGSLDRDQCRHIEPRLLLLEVLWTSCTVDDALKTVWIESEVQYKNAPLAVLNDPQPSIRMSATVPHTKHNGVAAGIERKQIDYFLAPDVAGIAALTKRYMVLRSTAFGEILGAGTRVFSCDHVALQRDAHVLLRTLSPTGRLTISRLSEVLFRYLSGSTGFDTVLATTCTARDHERLAGSALYYACRSEDAIQAAYVSVVQALRSAIRGEATGLDFDVASADSVPCFDFEYTGRYIGIPGLPRYSALKTLVHKLVQALLSCSISTRQERLTYCNMWGCYNAHYNRFGGPTFRPVISGVLRKADISPFDNIAQLRDKGVWRLAAVDPGLREQTNYNEAHVSKFGRADWGAFLRGSQGEFLVPSPSLMWKHTNQIFPVPLWTVRAVVYSYLLDAGAHFEDVSTLCMGHSLIGHSATDDYSMFVFNDAVKRLLPYIKDLLDYLGFRPVESRLV